ncbi:hypothetical protein D3C86_1831450 [compost metagenome]
MIPAGKLTLKLPAVPGSVASVVLTMFNTRLAALSSSSAIFKVTGVVLTDIPKPKPAVLVPCNAKITVSLCSIILSSTTLSGTST